MDGRTGGSRVVPFKGKEKTAAYHAAAEKEQNYIGSRIARARTARRMTLVQMSELLRDYGVDVGSTGINKWETGKAVPNAYQFLAVAHALGLEDDLRYFISGRAELNAEGQRKLAAYKADLIATGNYAPEEERRSAIRQVDMPVSRLPASAGTGAFLDEENFEMVSFPESLIPAGAEFGVYVSGDSMEPAYHDGQIVWVKACDRLKVGEVGIFIYDGDGYIKAYDERMPDEERAEDYTDSYGVIHSQPVLVSFNERYAPIAVSPDAGFQIVGKVL